MTSFHSSYRGELRSVGAYATMHDVNSEAQKRLLILLSIVCAGLLATCAVFFWKYSWLSIRVAFASEQTQNFEEMRSKALQSSPSEAVGCLQYVVHYYESGSKQEKGSRLDRIVERDRQHAIQEIISYLRAKTGQELGGSPDAWIRRYAQK